MFMLIIIFTVKKRAGLQQANNWSLTTTDKVYASQVSYRIEIELHSTIAENQSKNVDVEYLSSYLNCIEHFLVIFNLRAFTQFFIH